LGFPWGLGWLRCTGDAKKNMQRLFDYVFFKQGVCHLPTFARIPPVKGINVVNLYRNKKIRAYPVRFAHDCDEGFKPKRTANVQTKYCAM